MATSSIKRVWKVQFTCQAIMCRLKMEEDPITIGEGEMGIGKQIAAMATSSFFPPKIFLLI